MDNVIDFYALDRRMAVTSDENAKSALQSGVLMQFYIDEGGRWWIKLFKLVDYQITDTYINVSVIDMGMKRYSIEFRQSTFEPIFIPVPLGYPEGNHQAMHALALKNGDRALDDAISYLLPQIKEEAQHG